MTGFACSTPMVWLYSNMDTIFAAGALCIAWLCWRAVWSAVDARVEERTPRKREGHGKNYVPVLAHRTDFNSKADF